jgi:hypothetical protein
LDEECASSPSENAEYDDESVGARSEKRDVVEESAFVGFARGETNADTVVSARDTRRRETDRSVAAEAAETNENS